MSGQMKATHGHTLWGAVCVKTTESGAWAQGAQEEVGQFQARYSIRR